MSYASEVLADSPFVYLKLDETSGTTAADSSGNNRDASYVNVPTLGAASADSNLGTAVTFNGTDEYVDATTLVGFGAALDSGFTIEFWLKHTTTAQVMLCGTVNNGATTGIFLHLNTDEVGAASTNSLRLFIRDDAGTTANLAFTNAALNDGDWHHLVWTGDPSTGTYTARLDKVDQTLSTAGTLTQGATADFDFAFLVAANNARGTVELFYPGSLDEFALYTTPLTATRTDAHFDAAFAAPSGLSGTAELVTAASGTLSAIRRLSGTAELVTAGTAHLTRVKRRDITVEIGVTRRSTEIGVTRNRSLADIADSRRSLELDVSRLGWDVADTNIVQRGPHIPPPDAIIYGLHSDAHFFDGDDTRLSVHTDAHSAVQRSTLIWRNIETSQGVFDWSGADAMVNNANARGLRSDLYPWRAPQWANGSTDDMVIPHFPSPAFDTFKGQYANFCALAAARYASDNILWEIGNEPNERFFYKDATTGLPNRQGYSELFKAARTAMRAADPGARIAIGGLTSIVAGIDITGQDFLTGMLDEDGVVLIPEQGDAVACHVYTGEGQAPDAPWIPFERNFLDYWHIRDALDQRDFARVPLWVNEYGWQHAGPDFIRRSLEMIRDRDKSVEGKTWPGSAITPRIEVVCIFLDIDTPNFPYWGLYTAPPSLDPKLSADAFRTFAIGEGQ